MIDTIKHWAGVILAIVVILAVCSAVYNFKKPKAGPDKHWSDISSKKKGGLLGLAGAEYSTKDVAIEKVVVIDKKDVKDVPEPVLHNPDEELTVSGMVEPYEWKTKVWASVNTRTGTANIYSKRQPLPFFAFENDREFGVRYGFVFGDGIAETQIAIYGRWRFVRVGRLHLGTYIEGNSRPEGRAMLDLSYKF